MNIFKRIPWGTIAAIGTILVLLLSAGFFGAWFVLDAIAGQTHSSVGPFDNWWQTLICVADVAILAITILSYVLFFRFFSEKSSYNESRGRVPFIFSRSLHGILTGLFVFFYIGFTIGQSLTLNNSSFINEFLGINPYEIVKSDDGEIFNEYVSDFLNEDGSFNDKAMRNNSMSVALQTATEGTVLLSNENNALPLAKDSKISFFGIGSAKYVFIGEGSGHLPVTTTETLLDACADCGLTVNPKLSNVYRLLSSEYGHYTTNLGTTLSGTSIGDRCYSESGINEAPWSKLDSTSIGNVTSTFSEYGDAAVMIISRTNGEDNEPIYKTYECVDGNYLDLAYTEIEVLDQLMALKANGVFKKVILLINSANAMQMKHISQYDLDACVWVGQGGNVSYDQIAQILSGKANPSGKLIDTYLYDNYSAPSSINMGDFTFATTTGLPATETYTHNDKYVVYAEGIYVGYRYFETRYEDVVLGKANVGNYDYVNTVAYPFGYGLSYTSFEQSGFRVEKANGGYNVTVIVRNTGSVAGKDVVQVYLQKPYTEYDIRTGIEKASVELVGYAKTKQLKPGESQELTVFVDDESFKTYDSYGYGTYIVEAGDYYLAAGLNSHDALNNILAAKGKTTANGMDYNGNASFSELITIDKLDVDTYSKSTATGYEIVNQFNNADPTLYAGTAEQFKDFKYLTRNDWVGSYPTIVIMDCITQIMVNDLQYTRPVEEDPNAVMPTFGKSGTIKLLDLWGRDFDDPMWEDLLDQITWEEAVSLVTTGGGTGGSVSAGAPGGIAKDGPAGIGATNEGVQQIMCFPSECVMAATFNDELIEELGNAFGMEILHVGYTGIYAPGANIHRSAFSGRNWEYYSEDPFISGKMLASEVRGLQSRGVIVFTKHYALNDQERNRYGVSVWSNEQAIREIYLKAFEGGVTEGNMNGVMSSFNRIGTDWSGKHAGLLTEVLRNEWGFVGVVQTDAYVGTHMHRALAESVVAGNDFTMGGSNPPALDAYRDNATVGQALRDCAHRILYTQLHSNAMNGLTMDYKIVYNTPWWQVALETGKSVSETLAMISGILFLLSCLITLLIRRKFVSAILLCIIIIAGVVIGVAYGPAILEMLNPSDEPDHLCESICDECGGCEDEYCRESACQNKCTCIKPCDHACATCGLCLDAASTDERCVEKCGSNLSNSQIFEGEDGHVLLYGGILGNLGVGSEPGATETYISGMNANPGASAKFVIVAEEAGVANLSASAGKRYIPMAFMSNLMVLVNGEIMSSKAILPGAAEGENQWVSFVTLNLGCIELKEGRNVIEFVVTGNECFNFDKIIIKSNTNLTWYDGEHICDDVCSICGLCTKAQCEADICIEKCLCNTAKYEFNVSDGKAYLDGATVNGGVAEFTAKGQKLVYSLKACGIKSDATILLNVKANAEGLYLSDVVTIKLNGVELKLTGKEISAGEISTVMATKTVIPYGHNEIEIISKSDNAISIAGIVMACNDKLSYVDKNEFLTSDSHVIVSGGAYKSNEYCIVTHENAQGSVITFPINSSKATTADLYLEMVSRLYGAKVSDVLRIRVNGVEVSTDATVPNTGIEWITYSAVKLNQISLNAGYNEISFEVLTNDASINTNIRSISLQNSDAEFVWSDAGVKNHTIKIEAEKTTINSAIYQGSSYPYVTTGWSSSNDRYVAGMNDVGIYAPGQASISFTVNASSACDAKLYFGAGVSGSARASSYTVFVNGVEYHSTKNWGGDGWYDWSFHFYGIISLNAGENNIEIRIDTNEQINLDYFLLDSVTEITFVEKAAGGVEISGANQYLEEAEKVVCNGNIGTGGDDNVWRVEDANVSGGFYMARINEVSQEKPGYYYFKWSITAETDCLVNLYINVARNDNVNAAKAFPIKVNGRDITANKTFGRTSWFDFTTELLATIELKAGENTVYVYIGEGAACNIDYFVFATDATLTINETTLDAAAHYCESKCPVCGMCLNTSCNDVVCSEKCQGHNFNLYIEEAEKVTCNGNVATGGDDNIWRIETATSSGGFHLGRIGDVSASNPGYYYFKWSITVANDCTVTIGMNSARNGDINAATAFPAKLNGVDVVFDAVFAATSWSDFDTVTLGTVNLVAGENILYIYIGSGASCNIDFFTFQCADELVFNKVSIDGVAHECESACKICGKCLDTQCSEDACAEKCEGHSEPVIEYIEEAELVACNGNVGTGGDDNIWRNANSNRSGGFYLSRINDVSISNPGYYYFKWSITVEEACSVIISMNAGFGGNVNVATAFPIVLNGNNIALEKVIPGDGWGNYKTETFGTVELSAGENILYIYIGEGAACDIDYFVFESVAELTFNPTTIDYPHACESACAICGKCLDAQCSEDACAEKCEGHVVEPIVYVEEAEKVACNGNVATGGDDNIWRNETSSASGGFYLSRINDVSISNPGYYYFKWSITVANDCTVTIGLNSGRADNINAANAFPAKLNGENVVFDNILPASGWDNYNTAKLGTVDLKAGENILYIYIGTGACCNIDYFTFTSLEALTFNATTIDLPHSCENACEICGKCLNGTCTEDACAEKCEGHAADEPITSVQEAESVACNGNKNFGGDDQIWVIPEGDRSAGARLARINEVSSANPGYYYFKWSITVEEACSVTIAMNAAYGADINVATAFPIVLNGNEIDLETVIPSGGWGNYKTETFGTFELSAGENILYIYIGEGAACDIDFFTFTSLEALTFNATTIDLPHSCENACEICGKCLNGTCTEDACAEKCEGHVVEPIVYVEEAEKVACNGNVATGGDDNIWRIEGADYSGNFRLGRINDVSISNPGYYYFKWSITVANDCTVTIGMNAGCGGDINVATAFPIVLNGNEIALEKVIIGDGWGNYKTETLGTIELTAGENILYIYIGTGACCDIDYFTFTSLEALTFNATTIDLPHACESICIACGKCLDAECTEDVCANKCEGHNVDPVTVVQEAELVACNGNVGTGGDDNIWRNETSSASGGFYLSRINDVSISNPGYYYFKWSITVANDCTVTIGLNAGRAGDINAAVSFPAKLNGEDVVFDNILPASGWTDYNTATLGTVDLKAGENILYIYIGQGACCNIDYFTFTSVETLTFNPTTIDLPHACESVCPVCFKCLDTECIEDACAEKCEGHVVEPITYVEEAELVACNGNVGTGGDDQIWRSADSNRSGGMYLMRINDVSISNPGYYYFKWSITVEADCTVTIGMNSGRAGDINSATSFPAKLNGEDVVFANTLPASSWTDYNTATLGTVDLKAGENILYIYIGQGACCNIDYFTFTSVEVLTFNNTSIDG